MLENCAAILYLFCFLTKPKKKKMSAHKQTFTLREQCKCMCKSLLIFKHVFHMWSRISKNWFSSSQKYCARDSLLFKVLLGFDDFSEEFSRMSKSRQNHTISILTDTSAVSAVWKICEKNSVKLNIIFISMIFQ